MQHRYHRLLPILLSLLCVYILAGCAVQPSKSDSASPSVSGVSDSLPAPEADITGSRNTSGQPETETAESSDTSGQTEKDKTESTYTAEWSEMKTTGHLIPDYASEFAVDYYDNCSLITIGGTDRYLLLPEGTRVPSGLDSDIIPIRRPETIYLAASSAMDYFRVLGALDKVRLTSTQAGNWSLPEVVRALSDGAMIYAGKYSAPDYELLLRENIDLAIESTMIYHSPETKEKIEKLGIPVFVDKSSYEEHPLGRMEWIRLYGLLLGMSEEADNFYQRQLESLKAVPELDRMLFEGEERSPEKSAAYFYITSSGSVNIRRPGDYISRMIELAGGSYAFADAVSEGGAQATMNIQMEAFLDRALETDILIYSTSIDNEISSIGDLYSKVPLLAASRAAENDNIWITGKNMYQQTTAIAEMMLELQAVIAGNADENEMEFLHRLN
ncbi:MAG TPA: iron ABC transporter substrate-binding protein [Lachnospiraceae bacterium]|nr:iron ABC transporter substrate-binding protein [Lachnospiraceae bacterium]